MFDQGELAEVGVLEWRTRREGDYMVPMGMMGRKTLQDLMVDAKIPREQRDRIPVLAVEGSCQVWWVPGAGGRRSATAPVAEKSKRALVVRWSLSTVGIDQE
jgi:tRNA(Ile)-lysidine synthase